MKRAGLFLFLSVCAAAPAFAADTVGKVEGSGENGATARQPTLVTNATGPKIQFESQMHDFGRARAGEMVKYTYVFTNAGSEVLELTDVHPGCGCTTAGDWTRKVEPGKTGTISVQFNSSNFNGPVLKTITVRCNDKQNGGPVLQLKGTVWRALEVNPQFAVLNNVTADGPPGSTTVRIINNEDEPLTLFPPQSENRALAAELKTIREGKEYQLVISTVPPLSPGSLMGKINLRTSSPSTPVLSVTAYANVQSMITVTPPRINLLAAPLANPQSVTVNFVNNGKDAIALSEPAINADGVDVQLRETQPGRIFAAVVTFPQGFQIARGENLELSIKSSYSKTPVIKVPIQQMSRPNGPPVVPVRPQAAGARISAPSTQASSQ